MPGHHATTTATVTAAACLGEDHHRAKQVKHFRVAWAIRSNNLTSWSQLTPSLCWVGAIFVLLTALATRNGKRRLQKRSAQQNRASPTAFEDIDIARGAGPLSGDLESVLLEF